MPILDYFRTCPTCGKSMGKIPWLCTSCMIRVHQKLRLRKRQISSQIDHYYLYPWSGKELWQKRMVHSLKGGGPPWAYQYLSDLFPEMSDSNSPIYFPSRGRRDHASDLAEYLGIKNTRKTQALIKQTRSKQALLERSQRRNLLFKTHPQRVNCVDLVDDIVTTGATAEACFRALGQPKKMTVWSLFYRKSL